MWERHDKSQLEKPVSEQQCFTHVYSKMLLTWDFMRRLQSYVKPGFHMIVTVGDASPRQARGHVGDGCLKWEHFLNDVADGDGMGTHRKS